MQFPNFFRLSTFCRVASRQHDACAGVNGSSRTARERRASSAQRRSAPPTQKREQEPREAARENRRVGGLRFRNAPPPPPPLLGILSWPVHSRAGQCARSPLHSAPLPAPDQDIRTCGAHLLRDVLPGRKLICFAENLRHRVNMSIRRPQGDYFS
ncbi:hypothetical protein R5R35_002561 [Gryllus longicercus]|uniref:Uncharacterized protein n=1 Tax=Gryllus longicercus TaxID=2509291 RepID=A0AAN9ZAU4_9ORTH